MGVLTKEQIIEMIEGQRGLSRDEIKRRISEISKREGISEHAAALMLAEELGVNLEGKDELLHLADLVPGMSGVNVVARILRKYPPREYQKRDSSTGRVANLIIYDSTGRARLVLWDNLVGKYYEELKPGDVVKIIDPSVREGRNGIELHANFRTRIILNPEDPRVEEIPPLEEVRSYSYQRRKIGELMGGERFVEVRGTIARLYRVTAYDACPQCRRKVDYDPATGSWICPEHGEVKAKTVVIIDFGLDDSSGYIRTTLFGDDAAELLGRDAEDIAEKLKELIESGLTLREASRKLAEDEYYYLLGREIVVRGNVVDDKFLGLILKASSWDEVDPKREIARVRAELKKAIAELEGGE
ncbi:replication factor A [Thermococcus sp. M36]|uniref:OB-fold nucleic acid binding domain-containing protein n=1 Tax=Thermococcus sp. M36 TaxID=1638261 RepID=UPI00143C428D|nr:OB-fold nucleic acid binding domain-containing protein [Thermococcus sp. M36]NJE05839.1 replication factor A [Thermococcus sp. M36]